MSDELARQVDEVTVTDEQHARLLEVVTDQPGIGIAHALRQAGVAGTKGQLREYAAQHEELLDDIDEARAKRIRTELMTRAIDGVEETVYTPGGKVAGVRVVKSDRLLEFSARMYLPEARALRTGTVEHTGGMEVTNSDVSAAIDRFTSAVVQQAERGRTHGDDLGPDGAGEGGAGVRVAALDRPPEPASPDG